MKITRKQTIKRGNEWEFLSHEIGAMYYGPFYYKMCRLAVEHFWETVPIIVEKEEKEKEKILWKHIVIIIGYCSSKSSPVS